MKHISFKLESIFDLTHVAGAGELPLRIAPEKMLIFFESLPYTGLEIGLKNFFHLWPCKI